MVSRLTAETPEDLYGEYEYCPECGCDMYEDECPDCGAEAEDYIPEPDDYPDVEEYPVGYDGTPGLGWGR